MLFGIHPQAPPAEERPLRLTFMDANLIAENKDHSLAAEGGE